MSNDLRASELVEGMSFREYGMDDAIRIKHLDQHGDTMLITGFGGEETTLDIDTVVERIYPLPTFQMDVTGQQYGGAYWEPREYRVKIKPQQHVYHLTVEDSGGARVGEAVIDEELVEGIDKVASTDHGLSGYEDDWKIPTGMNRILVWDLPTNEDHEVRLDTAQIDEVAAWFRYATGEEVWDGGEVWEI